MRRSQPRANGQWLQVKITSVPALPATSAIETSLPSRALFILVDARGAGAPADSGPVAAEAEAGDEADPTARVVTSVNAAKLMDDLSPLGSLFRRGRPSPRDDLPALDRLLDRARNAAPGRGRHTRTTPAARRSSARP